jgi:small multidrug resistance pump
VTKWLLLACAIGSEITASLSLKAAQDRPGWYALTALGYLTSFALLTAVLRRGLPLGVTYGIWGAAGVSLTAVFGAVIFDETLTGVMMLGIVLVVAGVLLVELGHQQAITRAGSA